MYWPQKLQKPEIFRQVNDSRLNRRDYFSQRLPQCISRHQNCAIQNRKAILFMEKGLSKLLNWCNFSAIYVALVAQWIEQWIPKLILANSTTCVFLIG